MLPIGNLRRLQLIALVKDTTIFSFENSCTITAYSTETNPQRLCYLLLRPASQLIALVKDTTITKFCNSCIVIADRLPGYPQHLGNLLLCPAYNAGQLYNYYAFA